MPAKEIPSKMMPAKAKERRAKKHGKTHESALSEEALQTRKRILDAAERIFSRKGFDGARVDEIAEEAGVNKALIYYYFESKKALLEELVNSAIRELVAEKEAVFDSLPEKVNLATGDIPKELMRSGIDLTSRRISLLGILCTEALKDDDEVPALFRVMDKYMSSLLPAFKKAGVTVSNINEIRFPAFFFGFAPLIFFESLKDKWAEYYKTDDTQLKKEFYATFSKIYSAAMTSFFHPKR